MWSIGQYEGNQGFERVDIVSHDEVKELCEERACDFNDFRGLRHAAAICRNKCWI